MEAVFPGPPQIKLEQSHETYEITCSDVPRFGNLRELQREIKEELKDEEVPLYLEALSKQGNVDPMFIPQLSVPLAFRNDRHRLPIHGDGKIVDAAKINVRRDLPLFQSTKEMFSAGFEQGRVADSVKRLVFGRHNPAALRLPGFKLHNFVHHELPSAHSDFRVAYEQISARDLKLDDRLVVRLVLGVEESFCGGEIFRAEGFLLSGVVILAPENGASKEHPEFLPHTRFEKRA